VNLPFPAVRLQRLLNAPTARVFRALTDPAEAVRWWGPPDVHTSSVEIDLRVGGRCRWVMHPADGRAVLLGEIVEVDPPHLLVMTNRWEGNPAQSLVTIRLTAAGNQTLLELVHERLPRDAAVDDYDRWWTATVQALTTHLTGETSP